MSHFAVYECNVSNIEYVKKALEEMGLGYKENVGIIDYYGQKRQAVLAVVHEGRLLPLGWVREGNELNLQADWFMIPFSEKDFTNKVAQLHSKYQVIDICEENRWSVDDVTVNENGEIEILASSFA